MAEYRGHLAAHLRTVVLVPASAKWVPRKLRPSSETCKLPYGPVRVPDRSLPEICAPRLPALQFAPGAVPVLSGQILLPCQGVSPDSRPATGSRTSAATA